MPLVCFEWWSWDTKTGYVQKGLVLYLTFDFEKTGTFFESSGLGFLYITSTVQSGQWALQNWFLSYFGIFQDEEHNIMWDHYYQMWLQDWKTIALTCWKKKQSLLSNVSVVLMTPWVKPGGNIRVTPLCVIIMMSLWDVTWNELFKTQTNLIQ